MPLATGGLTTLTLYYLLLYYIFEVYFIQLFIQITYTWMKSNCS